MSSLAELTITMWPKLDITMVMSYRELCYRTTGSALYINHFVEMSGFMGKLVVFNLIQYLYPVHKRCIQDDNKLAITKVMPALFW